MMVTISTRPTAPAESRFFSAAKFGSKRRLKPIISGVPAASTTFRQASIRLASSETGFSQSTALPARAPFSMKSAWVSVEVAIRMASMSRSAMISSALVAAAPVAAARFFAAFSSTSATATSRASGEAAMLPP